MTRQAEAAPGQEFFTAAPVFRQPRCADDGDSVRGDQALEDRRVVSAIKTALILPAEIMTNGCRTSEDLADRSRSEVSSKILSCQLAGGI